MKLVGLSRLAIVATGCVQASSRFAPDTQDLKYQDYLAPLPSQYNLSDSQTIFPALQNSYWSSSFVSGSDNHEYLILSHVLVSPTLNVYRASVTDITDPSFYQQFTTFFNGSIIAGETDLDFAFDDYNFGLTSSDKLGSMTTSASHNGVQFNITYEMSSPIILNGGSGTFQWEVSPFFETVVNEWSMPAGRTVGTLQKDNQTIEIDSENSFTWYDRQWQRGGATNWTWFELHLQRGDNPVSEKVSMWFFPSGFDDSVKGFATIRQQHGIQTVIPAVFEYADRFYESKFNYTYPLEWTAKLADGTTLSINTTRDDQEITDPLGLLRTYEGYAEITGTTLSGQPVTGYGLVEIQPVLSLA